MATFRVLEATPTATNMLHLPTGGQSYASGPDTIEWFNGNFQWIWTPGAVIGATPVTTIYIDTNDVTHNFNFQITDMSFSRSQAYWANVHSTGNIAGLVVDMLGGNDTVIGNGASETLCGFAGNDILIGGGGADQLLGSLGNNTASYQTSIVGVTANLADPRSNNGDAAGDQYFSIHNLIGSRFRDQLAGDNGANRLTGGQGMDRLLGNGGPDIFDYNLVSESRRGSQRDQILDFQRKIDRIDLKDIDAKPGRGNQAFKFIGTDPFSGASGEVRYVDRGATVIVQADINGDRKADFEIFVQAPSLTRGDFIL